MINNKYKKGMGKHERKNKNKKRFKPDPMLPDYVQSIHNRGKRFRSIL